MTPELEKAARAVAASGGFNWDNPAVRIVGEKYARAALQSFLPPSHEMILQADIGDGHYIVGCAEVVFERMIRKAVEG